LSVENRYKITYDLKQRVITNIRFKQGDIDSSVIEITLVDNGIAVNITGETIEFRFAKEDKTTVYQDFTTGVSILDGPTGKVQCVLKSNTLAIAGLVACEIHRAKDGKELTTPKFYFTVESSIGADGIISSNYIGIIEDKILDWQAEVDVMKTEYDTFKGAQLAADKVTYFQAEINKVNEDLKEKAKQSDLDSTNNTVALKADKTYVDTKTASVASGSPKGTYATASALTTAFPSGNSNIYVVTADGGWYYWNGSAWTKGGTYQSTGVAPNAIDVSNLSDNIVTKGFPFASTANPNAEIRSAIKNIKLYNADPTKQYVLAVVRKNSASMWQLSIYEWIAGAYGSCVADFRSYSALPNTQQDITVPNYLTTNNIFAVITIDWSKISDAASYTAMGYSLTGLHSATIINQDDYSGMVLRNIAKRTSTKVNLTDLNNLINSTEIVTLSNTSVADQTSGAVTALILKFTVQDKSFNIFSFQGHHCINSNLKYAFCIIRNALGEEETHILNFVSGQLYKFVLSRTFNLNETITISYGYCDANFKTPTTNNNTDLYWASSTADTNISTTVVWYITMGTSIFDVGYGAGNANWKSANYSLINASRIILDINKPVVAPTQYNIVLPPKLYMLNSSIYYYYEDSFIKNSHIYDKAPCRMLLTANKLSDGSVITPYNYMEGQGQILGTDNYNLLMKIQDYSNSDINSIPVDILSKTINITSKAKPTGKSISVLTIGDSYMDAKWGLGILEYIKNFATTDGNTITYKGTRTSYGDLGENRSSWYEDAFYSKYVPLSTRLPANGDSTSALMSSPFVFSTDDTVINAKFDFAQYLSANNIAGIDTIVFFLGMNGGDGTKINLMIANMKLSLPNAKFLVCMVPPCEKDKYDIFVNSDSINRQLGRLSQNESYITKFQNREAEGIYLVPTHMNFNRVYSLNNKEIQQVQFNNTSAPTKTVALDHHPNATGAQGIGYMIYNYLMYIAP
jgi:hypothetical protein